MENNFSTLHEAITAGDVDTVNQEVQISIDANALPETILTDGLIAPMSEVGRRFEVGECFVPEMLIAARAMQSGLKILKPSLVEADVKPTGKVILGTVKNDLHDIGKNLVGMMYEGAGFEVIDLGIDVSTEQFIEAVKTESPDIIAMSALLTTTMPNLKIVIDALKEAGLRDEIKIMIGGAPVTSSYAEEIGADGFGEDAASSVEVFHELMEVS